MKQSIRFIIFLLGTSLVFTLVESFHIPIVRPEFGVIDVHPFYHDENQYLTNNNSTYTYYNVNKEMETFAFAHSRANLFGLVVLFTLVAHNLYLLPN